MNNEIILAPIEQKAKELSDSAITTLRKEAGGQQFLAVLNSVIDETYYKKELLELVWKNIKEEVKELLFQNLPEEKKSVTLQCGILTLAKTPDKLDKYFYPKDIQTQIDLLDKEASELELKAKVLRDKIKTTQKYCIDMGTSVEIVKEGEKEQDKYVLRFKSN